ncbi:hypothetical protein DPMN_075114 [Dreissena polymorpha]|uniref:Uncharacterized protein n=1 Tax=Dreissena polymorpha TaxID=45954 RepID=A0A9D3YJR7_DREPO|nr:hypothetical protein DPMN_075114 [Dreissena polymorpha]
MPLNWRLSRSEPMSSRQCSEPELSTGVIVLRPVSSPKQTHARKKTVITRAVSSTEQTMPGSRTLSNAEQSLPGNLRMLKYHWRNANGALTTWRLPCQNDYPH